MSAVPGETYSSYEGSKHEKIVKDWVEETKHMTQGDNEAAKNMSTVHKKRQVDLPYDRTNRTF